MKILKNTIRKGQKILIIMLFTMITAVAFAQDPPPPPGEDGGGNPADANNQLGGAAHIGGGVLVLLSLAIAYGGRYIYKLNKTQNEEELNTSS